LQLENAQVVGKLAAQLQLEQMLANLAKQQAVLRLEILRVK
jgi:hypothetical protein